MEMFVGCDLMASYDSKEGKHNIEGYFLMEKMDFENLKRRMMKMGISKFARLRSKIVKKFGFKIWKEIPCESALKQLKLISKSESLEFKSESDLVKYSEKL